MYANSKSSMRRALVRFLANESGATAIEYGLFVGLLSLVILSAVTAIGTKINAKLVKLTNSLN